MTLREMQAMLSAKFGTVTMITENTECSFDQWWEQMPNYCEPGTTMDTEFNQAHTIGFMQHFFEMIAQ